MTQKPLCVLVAAIAAIEGASLALEARASEEVPSTKTISDTLPTNLNAQQYFALAKIYLSSFQLRKAQACVGKLRELKTPECKQFLEILKVGYLPSEDPPESALVLFEEASRMLKQGRQRDEARAKCKAIAEQLEKQYPRLDWVYLLMHRCDDTHGTAMLQKMLAISPNSVPGNILLAQDCRWNEKETGYSAAARAKSIDPFMVELASIYFRPSPPKYDAPPQGRKLIVMSNMSKAPDKHFEEAMRQVQRDRALKHKFIDKNGKTVFYVGPNTKAARKFADGVLTVNASENFGNSGTTNVQLWNKAGDLIFQLSKGSIRNSSEGLCAFQDAGEYKNDNWGYVDHDGKIVVNPQFRDAAPFSDGLAAVKVSTGLQAYGEGKWGFIDRKGQIVIAPIYEKCSPFEEGLAVVSLNGKFGLINRQGVFVIPPAFDGASGFKNGVAYVAKWDEKNSCLSYYEMNKAGKLTQRQAVKIYGTPLMDLPFLYGESQLSFSREMGFESTIDKLRRKVTPELVRQHSFGKNGKVLYGYKNPAGKFVIPPSYAQAQDFSDGLAAVSTDGNSWGYIDKTGAKIIDEIYQEANPFAEGLANVGVIP